MSFITIVSGLPRSGTSLMMQMLVAGGMPPLTDGVRQPDEDNPRGYFEYEPVKRTGGDPSWVRQSEGKVVKVIHVLLDRLPGGFEYRVILMRRPIQEVFRSQQKMLERSGNRGADIPEGRLSDALLRQLKQAEGRIAIRPEFRVLPVNYRDCIEEPARIAETLCEFLALPLDIMAMQAAVEPSLHRNH